MAKTGEWRDWAGRPSALGLYLPFCEPRRIDDGALVHHSVFERIDAITSYRPRNLPPKDRVRIEPPSAEAEEAGAAEEEMTFPPRLSREP